MITDIAYSSETWGFKIQSAQIQTNLKFLLPHHDDTSENIIQRNDPPIIPFIFRQTICYPPSKKYVFQEFHILQYPHFYIK